ALPILDLHADRHAATGDRAVVADAEVIPVDLAGERETGPGVAVRVGAKAFHLELERGLPGDPPDGEVPFDDEALSVRGRLDAGGPVRHLRVRFDLEEVSGPDVVVALLVACVDR